jgi:hypothetical protein
MKTKLFAILGAVGLCCTGVLAQQPEKAIPKKLNPEALKKPAAAQPSEAEMMKAWMAAATPNENHRRLEPFVGAWDVDVTSQMDPSKPAEHTKGETINRWVLDGRFLLQEHTGTAMGMPFQGLGLWGYDNVAKAYVGVWADTMGTGCMTSTGQYDDRNKSWSMLGSYKDPTGQTIKTREVITLVSDDMNTFDFYQAGPDGKEAKAMTIVYTRKEAPKYEVKPIDIKPVRPANPADPAKN